MLNSTLISVIIPTYNRADKLRICLESLVNQSFKNFEVIVCDDGSTDDTSKVISEFETVLDLKYILDSNFGGPARPRNNGIRLAKGEVIAFLDSDDWWYPNKLEVSLSFIEGFDIVYHNLDKYIKLDKVEGIIKGRVFTTNIVKDLIVNGNGIPNSSVLIRKSIVDQVGEITEDKNLIAVEDSDYWIRVAQVTDKFKYINKSLGAYWVGDNISLSEKQMVREKALFTKYEALLSNEEKVQSLKLLSLKKARILHKLDKFVEAGQEYNKAFTLKYFNRNFKISIGLLACFFKIKI